MAESGTVRAAAGRYSRFSRSRLFASLESLGGELLGWNLEETVRKIQRRVEDHPEPVEVDKLVDWVASELSQPARAAYLQSVRGIASEVTDRFEGPGIVKRDGRICWFDGRKLRDSLACAAHRSMSPAELDAIADSIKRRVLQSARPVATEEIRAWVEERLWQHRCLAAVRYSSGGAEATLARLLRHITGVDGGHVQKRGGELEPFDRCKLARSLELAFGKRGVEREVRGRIERFAGKLAKDAADLSEPISTREIGERALAWLEVNEEEAFIRYLVQHRRLCVHRRAELLEVWRAADGLGD